MGWVTQGEAHSHNSALLSFTNLGLDNLNDLALERTEGAIQELHSCDKCLTWGGEDTVPLKLMEQC